MQTLSDKEITSILYLAGRLAIAAQNVVSASALDISHRVKELNDALADYNNAVLAAHRQIRP